MRSALFAHDNDYGLSPIAAGLVTQNLSISCVVPYYETGWVTARCVGRITRALQHYQASGARQDCQIVVVDDGSSRRPFPDFEQDGLRVVRLEENQGRSAARNIGLRSSAGFDLTAFVDSDVLVADDHFCRIAELWDPGLVGEPARPAIVAGLLSTLRDDPATIDLDHVVASARMSADWRWWCRFQPSWVGTRGDWTYVGHPFRLVVGTNFFRTWSGMIGPWSLANMVLGGSFAVPTDLALAAGGFDESFAAYGFTETTLIARLIARGVPVIPQVKSAAVHIEDHPGHHHQSQRDQLLQVAHRRFFTGLLAKRADDDDL